MNGGTASVARAHWRTAPSEQPGGDDKGKQLPRPRCIIINPARRSGTEHDQLVAGAVARSFAGAGYEVIWLVDRDDPIFGCTYARSLKVLEPGGDAQQSVDVSHEQNGTMGERSSVKGTLSESDASSGQVSTVKPIKHLDLWARQTWHSRGWGVARLAALVVWVTIRLIYSIQRAAGHTWWRTRVWAVSMISRLVSILAMMVRLRQRIRARLRSLLAPILVLLARKAWLAVTTVLTGPLRRRSDGGLNAEGLLAAAGEQDVVILPAAECCDLEAVLQLLPTLRLEKPLPTTLHVRFASAPPIRTDPTSCDLGTLGLRLRSGCPFRTLVLHADTETQAHEVSRRLGLPVHRIEKLDGAETPNGLLDRFGPAAGAANNTLRRSLVVGEFGPVVLLVSAFWGRVGSTTIFDQQTKYLIDRGCVVVRVFIEHHPHSGEARRQRVATFLPENFSNVRPHCHLLVQRNDGVTHLARLMALPEFRRASPVARVGLLLADAHPFEPTDGLGWAARRAALAVVNHVPHVQFTQTITKAPIILVTHDIFSDLLTTHGIPTFVPSGPDSLEQRRTEEREIWAEVAACVNVSPHDHEIVSRAARVAALVKPYSPRRQSRLRPWPDVLAANNLDPQLWARDEFDLMLWGSWHDGNVAGILWFLDEVVPLNAALRNARILIVGRVLQGLRPVLSPHRHVLAVGFVDQLEDFALRSRVLVIPDQTGSGMSVKAIEAAALGRCFSATTQAMRGFDLGRTGFRPSATKHELAEDVALLLGSDEARRTRANIAGLLYDLNLSLDAQYKAWDSVLGAVAPTLIQPASPSAVLDRARQMVDRDLMAGGSSHADG